MLSKVKLVCCLEASNELQKQRNRIHWVHPYNVDAKAENRFRKFYESIRSYETKFFGYYRMSIKSFEELLVLLRPHIIRQNTNKRLAVSAEERLTITIR